MAGVGVVLDAALLGGCVQADADRVQREISEEVDPTGRQPQVQVHAGADAGAENVGDGKVEVRKRRARRLSALQGAATIGAPTVSAWQRCIERWRGEAEKLNEPLNIIELEVRAHGVRVARAAPSLAVHAVLVRLRVRAARRQPADRHRKVDWRATGGGDRGVHLSLPSILRGAGAVDIGAVERALRQYLRQLPRRHHPELAVRPSMLAVDVEIEPGLTRVTATALAGAHFRTGLVSEANGHVEELPDEARRRHLRVEAQPASHPVRAVVCRGEAVWVAVPARPRPHGGLGLAWTRVAALKCEADWHALGQGKDVDGTRRRVGFAHRPRGDGDAREQRVVTPRRADERAADQIKSRRDVHVE